MRPQISRILLGLLLCVALVAAPAASIQFYTDVGFVDETRLPSLVGLQLPWVAATSFPSLNAAIASIGSTQTSLLISGPLPYGAATTVPNNVTLRFMGAGQIDCSSAAGAVTINGPVVADVRQIFVNCPAGSVTYGSHVAEVFTQWWGALVDGTTDEGGAVNAALAAMANGGTLVLTPGTHFASTEIFINNAVTTRLRVLGRGATIKTSGAISGIRARGGSTGILEIEGLSIDHDGDANALYGINIDGLSANVRLNDIFVYAGSRVGYAGIHIGQTTLSDANTGAFWNEINHVVIRDKDCGTTNCYTYGVLLEGAGGNATNIRGGQIANATESIRITDNGSISAVPGGVVVQGMDLERATTGIRLKWVDGSVIAGHRFINNRAENLTNLFHFEGTGTAAVARGPYLSGNDMASSVTNYLTMPTAIRYVGLDYMVTPDVGAFILPREVVITPQGGSAHSLELVSPGGNRGVVLRSGAAGSTAAAQLSWQGSGTLGRVGSGASNNLNLTTIRGISNTLTDAVNLRGNKTLDGTTPSTVTLPTAEPDATYFVWITCEADPGSVWVTNKLTTAFDINTSGAHNMVCNWLIVR